MNKRTGVIGAALLWCVGSPVLAEVGFAQFDIQTQHGGPVPVAIWYPTDAAPTQIKRGPFIFLGAENAVPEASPHPLVIISHGSASGQLTHVNLAVHLANAGYIVAAPTHAHDNFQDESGSGTAEVIKGRAETISNVIDRISAPNPLNLIVNSEQIGVVGFSAGGATALSLGGLRPSMIEALNHCEAYRDPFCQFVAPDDQRFVDTTPMSGLGDSRVRSIVALAPATAYFSDAELATLTVPIFVFAPAQDAELSPTANAERLRDNIQTDLTFYKEPEAGHFSVLPVFPEATWDEVPMVLRADVEGFDRSAFHQRLFDRVVGFLDESLSR